MSDGASGRNLRANHDEDKPWSNCEPARQSKESKSETLDLQLARTVRSSHVELNAFEEQGPKREMRLQRPMVEL